MIVDSIPCHFFDGMREFMLERDRFRCRVCSTRSR
jgi:hypothetical protein